MTEKPVLYALSKAAIYYPGGIHRSFALLMLEGFGNPTPIRTLQESCGSHKLLIGWETKNNSKLTSWGPDLVGKRLAPAGALHYLDQGRLILIRTNLGPDKQNKDCFPLKASLYELQS